MGYLIDGHNLIPKIPGMSLRMEDDEQELIQLLQDFSRYKRKEIEVFFDQAAIGQAGSQRYGHVRAHFVVRGRTADQAILSRLRKLGRTAPNWTVVSSDRAVQNAARMYRANVLSSEQFSAQLQTMLHASGDDPGEKREARLSEAEVDEWLKLFKRGKQ